LQVVGHEEAELSDKFPLIDHRRDASFGFTTAWKKESITKEIYFSLALKAREILALRNSIFLLLAFLFHCAFDRKRK
jgi:hypothetical protein